MSKGGLNPKTVVFIGLMLGMLVAAVSQTIVSPAMPVIVAELGALQMMLAARGAGAELASR